MFEDDNKRFKNIFLKHEGHFGSAFSMQGFSLMSFWNNEETLTYALNLVNLGISFVFDNKTSLSSAPFSEISVASFTKVIDSHLNKKSPKKLEEKLEL